MALASGEQLGHYKIQSLIGKGGMGEVHRALDIKLDRDVAIKVLPAAVASDPDRLARFEREAEVLAQLNHPGIAAIHGVEDRALIMELVPYLARYTGFESGQQPELACAAPFPASSPSLPFQVYSGALTTSPSSCLAAPTSFRSQGCVTAWCIWPR